MIKALTFFILMFYCSMAFSSQEENIVSCQLKAYIYSGQSIDGKRYKYESNWTSPDVMTWDGGRCEIKSSGVFNLVIDGKKYIINGFPSEEAFALKNNLIKKADEARDALVERINQLDRVKANIIDQLKIKGQDLSSLEFEANSLIEKYGGSKLKRLTDQEEPNPYFVSSNSLNVRAKAGADGAKLKTLSKGERVNVYETKGEWARIGAYYENGTSANWVSLKYLSKTKPNEKSSEPDSFFGCDTLTTMVETIVELNSRGITKEEAIEFQKRNLGKIGLTKTQQNIMSELFIGLTTEIYQVAKKGVFRANRDDTIKIIVNSMDSNCN